MTVVTHPYSLQEVALATRHEKGAVIAPEFSTFLGMKVVEFAVDTDSLGTFSGEVERAGSAKDVVIRKANLGISASGLPFGLASEGSIGVDPIVPFINSDIELMAFVDVARDLTIVETFRSTEIIACGTIARKDTDLRDFLLRADFPNHKLIVKSSDKPISFAVKGIGDVATLELSLERAFKDFPEVVIESDLRAHCSPSRMENIGKLAHKLARRLANLCPECSTPGWGVVDVDRGLPCSECGEISQEAPRVEILGCFKCSCTHTGKVLALSVDPSRCDLCNP